MHPSRANNPLFGPNRFKLGVFSANCDGGLTMSLAPERWPANWDDIAAMCQIADQAGMEFILPVAKWRGYQGKANIYGQSFETMTHSAATRRADQADLRLLDHPRAAGDAGVRGQGDRHHRPHHAWPRRPQHRLRLEPGGVRPARRQIDQDTPLRSRAGVVPGLVAPAGGRAGVRLGRPILSSARLETDPVSVQRPCPLVMSAGFSPKGRDFAAQAADVLFTTMSELDQAPAMLADVAEHAAQVRQAAAVSMRWGTSCAGRRGARRRSSSTTSRRSGRRRGPGLLPQPAGHDDGTRHGTGAASAGRTASRARPASRSSAPIPELIRLSARRTTSPPRWRA